MATTSAEVMWLRSLLQELDVHVNNPPSIYCDNLRATHYAANSIFHSRMKHLALAFHFVREQVQRGTLRVQHISGCDQLADSLTKPLARSRLHDLSTKIGLVQRPSILRGHVEDINQSKSTMPN